MLRVEVSWFHFFYFFIQVYKSFQQCRNFSIKGWWGDSWFYRWIKRLTKQWLRHPSNCICASIKMQLCSINQYTMSENKGHAGIGLLSNSWFTVFFLFLNYYNSSIYFGGEILFKLLKQYRSLHDRIKSWIRPILTSSRVAGIKWDKLTKTFPKCSSIMRLPKYPHPC